MDVEILQSRKKESSGSGSISHYYFPFHLTHGSTRKLREDDSKESDGEIHAKFNLSTERKLIMR
jgi:hypothetical protein